MRLDSRGETDTVSLYLHLNDMLVNKGIALAMLWFVQALSEEIHIKTFERGKCAFLTCPNVKDNETNMLRWNVILSNGSNCQVSLWDNKLNNTCGPRLNLHREQNATLHITNFSHDDEGIYTCEITDTDGNHQSIFNVSIQESDANYNFNNVTSSPIKNEDKIYFTIAVFCALLIVIILVMLFVLWRKGLHDIREKAQDEGLASPPDEFQDQNIQPYSTFMQRNNGLYSTFKVK